jgi:dihydroorotase-like cyclic amidohydrolase
MVVDGSKYNPYSGMNISCWPSEVILRGNTIVKDNLIKSEPGSGKFLSTKLSEFI